MLATDTPGLYSEYSFGGVHPGGWYAVLCAGSVKFISFSIDLMVHRWHGNREDGQVHEGL